MCPSERTIQAVKVSLQGLQTLAFPDPSVPSGVRYEEKVIMNKAVTIVNSPARPTLKHRRTGRGSPPKEKVHPPPVQDQVDPGSEALGLEGSSRAEQADELALNTQGPSSRVGALDVSHTESVNIKQEGLHLTPGVHGFEYAFIVPSSSPAFERTKDARLRYVLQATALGAGRTGKEDVSTWQDVFVIVQVQPDGGPTALDLQYHGVHEALGPIAIAVCAASLTVGGTASVQINHPDPAPGLSVHVIRVFLEQTVELYSEQRKAWAKLPAAKLRLWEKGCMPYKNQPFVSTDNTIWFARTDSEGLPVAGYPGRGAGDGAPNMSPFGHALTGTFAQHHPAGPPQLPSGHPHGYTIKSILRLPDHRSIRPSTIRGSKTDIRITHEIGVEVFFSRTSKLDDRPGSNSFGMPKVQVFSMRRAIAIPSCACTHDTIHLPPYSLESPIQSRPPSPHGHQTMVGTFTVPGTPTASTVDLHRFGRDASRTSSRVHSLANSRAGSRDTSPEWEPRKLFSGLTALKHGRRSRHSSPERYGRSTTTGLKALTTSIPNPTSSEPRVINATTTPSQPSQPIKIPTLSKSASHQSLRASAKKASGGRTSGTSASMSPSSPQRPKMLTRHSYHGTRVRLGLVKADPTPAPLAPLNPTQPDVQPPATPQWSHTPPFYAGPTNTARARCNCGRESSALADAEQRLLSGIPTAPGAWVGAHDSDALPPPWIAPIDEDDMPQVVIRPQTDRARWAAKATAMTSLVDSTVERA